MKRLLQLVLLGSLMAGSLDACVVRARPAPVYEVVPAPRPGYVWIRGHWEGGFWVRGHWRVV